MSENSFTSALIIVRNSSLLLLQCSSTSPSASEDILVPMGSFNHNLDSADSITTSMKSKNSKRHVFHFLFTNERTLFFI